MPTEFLVLFREPNGRAEAHDPVFAQQHQQHWQDWFAKYDQLGKLAGGQALTLEGQVLHRAEEPAQPGPHRVGTEIVGGYLLLKATDLEEATSIIRECPIFEAGGYAEIRPVQSRGNE